MFSRLTDDGKILEPICTLFLMSRQPRLKSRKRKTQLDHMTKPNPICRCDSKMTALKIATLTF